MALVTKHVLKVAEVVKEMKTIVDVKNQTILIVHVADAILTVALK